MRRQRCDEDSSSIVLIRTPILPLLSTPPDHVLFRPFVSPVQHPYDPLLSDEFRRRRLGAAVWRKSAGGGWIGVGTGSAAGSGHISEVLKDINPLELPVNLDGSKTMRVDQRLTRFLREHQREGVRFICMCLLGLGQYPPECVTEEQARAATGCLLADDMGLGKTLQSLSAMWTLLSNVGEDGKPLVRKVLILCPASLVGNWAAEVEKWIGVERCPITAVVESVKVKVQAKIEGFKYDRMSKVLICSYETFRLNLKAVKTIPLDLIIADEAHRLKNLESSTAAAVYSMECNRRLLLTGTPLQNDLGEFFALACLTNRAIFPDGNMFRKTYTLPILHGTSTDASEKEQAIAKHKLETLSRITNTFILRRSNHLLAKVLPDKLIINVFCGMSPVQCWIYERMIKLLKAAPPGGVATLGAIQALLKLCTHPLLVPMSSTESRLWDDTVAAIADPRLRSTLKAPPKFHGPVRELRQVSATSSRVTRSSINSPPPPEELKGEAAALSSVEYVELSGKFVFIFALLKAIRDHTQDKVVIVSNYTQTLDLIESWCRADYRFPIVRLDGATPIAKRHQCVTQFNAASDSYLFLLSSKAGGCGINLIGANRLILVDPGWNPATDKQALARIWRDGQKKMCLIYRIFCGGTMEEKIFERQIAKESLGSMVVCSVAEKSELKDMLPADVLRDLFSFDSNKICNCDTHAVLKCTRCGPEGRCDQMQEFREDDLMTWSHSRSWNNPQLHAFDPDVMRATTERFSFLSTWRGHKQAPVTFVMAALIKSQKVGNVKLGSVCLKTHSPSSVFTEDVRARKTSSLRLTPRKTTKVLVKNARPTMISDLYLS